MEKRRPGEHGSQSAGVDAASATPSQATELCKHGIGQAKCPFCIPGLVESDGLCKEHDVAEALCVKCRPYLETAFKAEGDWCDAHRTPESQCTICNPKLNDKDDGHGG